MVPTSKDFFRVGERRIPGLNDTLDLQEGEEEKGRLVPRAPLEEPFDDEEEEELLPRPEVEAVEANYLSEERFVKSLICESSFT